LLQVEDEFRTTGVLQARGRMIHSWISARPALRVPTGVSVPRDHDDDGRRNRVTPCEGEKHLVIRKRKL
jgi:hypothetical protein